MPLSRRILASPLAGLLAALALAAGSEQMAACQGGGYGSDALVCTVAGVDPHYPAMTTETRSLLPEVMAANDMYVQAAQGARDKARASAAAMVEVQSEFDMQKQRMKFDRAVTLLREAELQREVALAMAEAQASAAVRAEEAYWAHVELVELAEAKMDAAKRVVESSQAQSKSHADAKALALQGAQLGLGDANVQRYDALYQEHAAAETHFQEMQEAATLMIEAAAVQANASTRAASLAHAAALAHANAANSSAESMAEYSTSAMVAQVLKTQTEEAYQRAHVVLRGAPHGYGAHWAAPQVDALATNVGHEQALFQWTGGVSPQASTAAGREQSLSGFEAPPQSFSGSHR